MSTPFRVGGTAHVHLTLDVDHVATPHTYGGSDARSLAKRLVAELDDRQPVDLADNLALCLHVDGFAQHLLLQQVCHPVIAENAGVDSLLDMFGPDHSRASLLGEVIRFLQQIDNSPGYWWSCVRNR